MRFFTPYEKPKDVGILVNLGEKLLFFIETRDTSTQVLDKGTDSSLDAALA